MSSPTSFRIDSLTLSNFRCFSECQIAFENDLTVLVAENGEGKSAILQAAGIAMGSFVNFLTGTYQSRGFGHSDIHFQKVSSDEMEPALPSSYRAKGFVAGSEVEWHREILNYSETPRSTSKGTKTLREQVMRFKESLNTSKEEVTLPLVASYSTGRLWREQISSKRKRFSIDQRSRLVGYADCFSSSSPVHGFLAWYLGVMQEIGSPQFATDLSRNLPLINAVRNAVREVLEPSGWDEMNWSPKTFKIVVTHKEFGQLPMEFMSDGVQGMIALVADIAQRCTSLNPHFKEDAARRTPGILLIDEVDMHLHPRWQQVVINLLQNAFPQMQIIVSTHSPHVLSTVNARSIRVIELQKGIGHVRPPHSETRGTESSAVLADVMGVDATPPVEEAKMLSAYRALVQSSNEDSIDASELRARLLEHYGPDHPVMEEVKVLHRLQEFRRAKRLPPPTGE